MKTTDQPAHSRSLRMTQLAACLAVALATSSAGALNTSSSASTASAQGNRALFGDQVSSVRKGDANRRRPGTARGASVMRPAALVEVTNCDDDGPGSLREAAADAANFDVITMHRLTCSTISLSSGPIEITADDVTLLGPGQGALTIDGNQNERVLYAMGNSLSVTDLTIANGRSTDGVAGCIDAYGDLILTRSAVTGCEAGDGNNPYAYGAGANVRGDLVMVSSTISGSHAVATDEAFGGGAYVGGAAVLYGNNTVSGNSVVTTNDKARGGGIFAKEVVYLFDSEMVNNSVTSTDGTAYGGAIATSSGNTNISGAYVIESTISGNTAHSATQWSYGAGIQAGDDFGASPGALIMLASTLSGNVLSADCDTCYIQGGGANVFGKIIGYYSTIMDNHVISAASSDGKARGGGLATFVSGEDGMIGLMNSTVSGNSALGGQGGVGAGGGIASLYDSPFLLIGSTVAFNRASTRGGGAMGGNAGGAYASEVKGSIVSNNEAPVAADLSALGIAFTIGGSNSLVMDADTDLTLNPDTLDVDPQLLPLAANGGLTLTHAIDICSPAIDAGGGFTAQWDQRAEPYSRTYGAGMDIGAFEWQPAGGGVLFQDGFEEITPCR